MASAREALNQKIKKNQAAIDAGSGVSKTAELKKKTLPVNMTDNCSESYPSKESLRRKQMQNFNNHS